MAGRSRGRGGSHSSTCLVSRTVSRSRRRCVSRSSTSLFGQSRRRAGSRSSTCLAGRSCRPRCLGTPRQGSVLSLGTGSVVLVRLVALVAAVPRDTSPYGSVLSLGTGSRGRCVSRSSTSLFGRSRRRAVVLVCLVALVAAVSVAVLLVWLVALVTVVVVAVVPVCSVGLVVALVAAVVLVSLVSFSSSLLL